MSVLRRVLKSAVVVNGIILLTGVTPLAAQEYSIIELGALPEGAGAIPSSVNRNRQIVGTALTSPLRAFYLDRGGYQIITPPAWGRTRAFGINDRGEVVGTAILPGQNLSRAFVWKDGVLQDLGTLPGGTFSNGAAINQLGQVVGFADDSAGRTHGFLWEQSTGMLDIGPMELMSGADHARPLAMNTSMQIVGYAQEAGGDLHAFLWDKGVMTDLGTLSGGLYSIANDINEQGEIVGDSTMGHTVNRQACRWRDGQLEPLDPAGYDSSAFAINNHGHIVGASVGAGGRRAILWRDGAAHDLNDFISPDSGWSLVYAYDINDAGEIVGSGYFNDRHLAFLLIPKALPLSATSGR